MKRLICLLLALAVLAVPALAQNQKPYVYAWAQVEGESTIYVSDRVVTSTTNFGDREANERWERALNRHGVTKRTYNWIGMPKTSVISNYDEADDQRVSFINNERGKGMNIIIVHW